MSKKLSYGILCKIKTLTLDFKKKKEEYLIPSDYKLFGIL